MAETTNDYGSIIKRADGSYVINDGMYHVPNDGEFAAQWAAVDAYAKENPDNVTAEKIVPPTATELLTLLRSERDARLSATDKYLMPDYPISAEKLAEVKAYRQALRDLPTQSGAPWDGGGEETPWPTKPEI